MKKLKSISVFFPCFNDGKILPSLLTKVYKILPVVSDNFEVFIIDDGSTDNSREVVKRMQKQYKNLKLFVHPENLGYGAVLNTGFKKAAKEWVFYTDGDGQYDPFDIKKLIKKLDKNTDIVNGYKLRRADSFLRKMTGSMYSFILHLLYQLPISDIDCDFRLIRRSFSKNIKLKSVSGAVCLELILKLKKKNARFKEVAVSHYPRLYGQSAFFNPKNVLKTFIENIRLFNLFRF